MHWSRFFVVCAVGLVVPGLSSASAAPPTASDEQTLKAAHVGTDGPSLLEYFRKRTVKEIGDQQIAKLIDQLGDDSFKVRQRASAELVWLGTMALPFLQRAAHSDDIEVVRRAERCLEQIKSGAGVSVPLAAARLLRLRKPAGAAAVLLAFLPSAGNALVAEEARQTLAAVAVRNGQPEKVLVAALTDKVPLRRAAAAEALLQASANALKPAIGKLLKDPDPAVRFRVAVALVHAQDQQAIPVLIDLLVTLPRGQACEAEDLLCRLAEERAPRVSLGNDPVARQKCWEAWMGWWEKHGSKVDLAKLDRACPTLGYTMVVLLERGMVMELGKDDKPRWQIEGLQLPLDAQLLVNNHVLVAEQAGNRVTERTLKGEIVWQKEIDGPLMAQRLRNGNTFIATRNRLVEVDRAGKEVFSWEPPGREFIMRAQKIRHGEIACVLLDPLHSRTFMRLDADGKLLQSFAVNVQTSGGRIEVLPNGHVLVPEMYNDKVVEYNNEGKPVAVIKIPQPIAAVRLANGHTLITSMTQNRAVEVNRTGKEVWQFKSDTKVTRAWRR